MEIRYLHHGDGARTALVNISALKEHRERLRLHDGAIALLEHDQIDPSLVCDLAQMLGKASKIQAVTVRDSKVLVMSSEVFRSVQFDHLKTCVAAFESIVRLRRYTAICLEHNPVNPMPETTEPSKKKRVMLFVPYGSYMVHNQVDAVLGLALAIRGAEVFAIGCDGLFTDNCYVLYHEKDKRNACAHCAASGASFFSQFGLSYESMRIALTEEDFAEASRVSASSYPGGWENYECDGIPIGKIIQTSICSYLRITTKSFHEEKVQKLFAKYAAYSLLCYRAMSRILDSRNPDQVTMFNGNGFLHGIVFYLAKKRGIPVLCHEKGMSEGTFIVNDSEPASSPLPMIRMSRAWKDVSLTNDEISKVKEFFISREHGTGMNYELFYRYKTPHATALKQLRIPKDSKIVGMFTSSEYELVYWGDFMRIPDQIDMIDHLINIFKEREEYLVVRHHPAIAARDTSPPDFHLMTRAWDQARRLPRNVRIVHPAEKLTTYALLPHVTACIAPFSAVSIEATARGINTATWEGNTLAEAVFKTVRDVSFDALNDVISKILEHKFGVSDLVRLYRSTHALFYHHPVKFKSFSIKNHSDIDIRIKNVEELLPGNDETLDRICNYVFNGTSLYDLPKNRVDTRREEIETLEQEFKNIVEYRTIAHESAEEVSETQVLVVDAILPGMPVLSESVRGQRHASIVREQWFITGNLAQDISSLENILANSKSHFLTVWFPGVEYDSSYISSSVDRLLSESNKLGIIWGGWGRGKLRFEQKISATEMVLYSQQSGEFTPLWAICSTLFSMKAIPELLSLLREGRTSDERTSNLRQFLLEGPFIKEDVQSVAVPSRQQTLVIVGEKENSSAASLQRFDSIMR